MDSRWLGLWRCVVADIFYIASDPINKRIIDADVDRYLTYYTYNKTHKNRVMIMNYLLLSWDKTFRNVLYYRMRFHPLLSKINQLFLPKLDGIEIDGYVEEGLYLSHNFMVVHPEKAGKNLRVGPGVVIGKNKEKYPVIGNNVYIAANSVVIGDIEIGDNVIIGAGSVVTKSLKGNAVYAGNPARFIRNIDDDEHLLNMIRGVAL